MTQKAPTDLQFRVAIADDIPVLLPLFEAFFREEGITTPLRDIADNLAKMIDFPTSIVLVGVQADNTLIGFASASLTAGVEFGVSAEIEDLYLSPETRGRGLSQPLMAAIIAACRDRGAQKAVVVVTQDGQQQGLRRFYEAAGFYALDRVMFAKDVR